jgi:hypothetical protein
MPDYYRDLYRKSVFLLCMSLVSLAGAQQRIELSGEWKMVMDPDSRGLAEEMSRFTDAKRVILPGTLTTNDLGNPISLKTQWTGNTEESFYTDEKYAPYRRPGNIKFPWFLNPVREYVGPAWYHRTINVPESWADKDIQFFFERCHWETQLYIDGVNYGTENSLSAPHIYIIKDLAPGEHQLSLLIDNSVKINVGINAHSVTDHTQTNWNGVIGEMYMKPVDRIRFESVQIFPDISTRAITIRGTVVNNSTKKLGGKLQFSAALAGTDKKRCFNRENVSPGGTFRRRFTGNRIATAGENDSTGGTTGGKQECVLKAAETIDLSAGTSHFEYVYPLQGDIKLWDEFDPAIYELKALLIAGSYSDSSSQAFGMREVATEGTQITLNGRKTFLRGNLECCIFPLTGAPPTTVAEWEEVYSKARSFGMNHFRFHSWCPPRAAFIAADKLGFMLQVETPVWPGNPDEDEQLVEYIIEEGARILQTYGNHPSFTMFSVGNEIGEPGNNDTIALYRIMSEWKKTDGRRLYSSAAGWPSLAIDDYHVRQESRVFNWMTGASTRLDTAQLNTTVDYLKYDTAFNRPYVSHEVASWCVYPDFGEIEKYTGVLKPYNLEIARDLLEKKGMLHQADDFHMASGKFQSLIIKEEIEALLRTPGHAGFQQLQLQDFPGQGTALVGVLDAFRDEKGYITADDYRQFCDTTVLLARMSKVIWYPEEHLDLTAEIAHYGSTDIKGAIAGWTVTDYDGDTIQSGILPGRLVPTGNLVPLGRISVDLKEFESPGQYSFTLQLNDGGVYNDWDFWVYAGQQNAVNTMDVIAGEVLEAGQNLPTAGDHGIAGELNKDVLITSTWNQSVVEKLLSGASVLFTPPSLAVRHKTSGRFSPVFWNRLWFNFQRNHLLGLLCDPEHGAFRLFPTDEHTNWQWYDILEYSKPIVLDDFSGEIEPVVQLIDDWNTSRKLGLAFEGRVGKGKLFVLSVDLQRDIDKRPATRQLLTSILSYMNSNAFRPDHEIRPNDIDRMLYEFLPIEEASIVSCSSEERDTPASNLLVEDVFSVWHTEWKEQAPVHPHHVVIDLGREKAFGGVALVPRQDGRFGAVSEYDLFVGNKPGQWHEPLHSGTLPGTEDISIVQFERPVSGRYIKFIAKKGFNDEPWACLSKIRLLPVEKEQ